MKCALAATSLATYLDCVRLHMPNPERKVLAGEWKCVGSGGGGSVQCDMRWYVSGRRTGYMKKVWLPGATGNEGCYMIRDTTPPDPKVHKDDGTGDDQ
jgi:hypothetical protein